VHSVKLPPEPGPPRVGGVRAFVCRRPLLCYFGLVYLLSLLALAVIGLPRLSGGGARPTISLVMFPIMVIGVACIGIVLTRVTSGTAGMSELRSRFAWPARRRWLLVTLVPPAAILGVLSLLRALVSPNFAPGFFIYGIGAGLLAGFCEEIGWTGFAYPRMRTRFGALAGALLLGVLWGLWHLPVVDSLGTASPHGRYWPEFFASFVAMLVALRVLIAWVYNNTGRLLMAQLLHASSTGFLVVLSASQVTPAQEAMWYLAYAGVLGIVAVVAIAMQGYALGSAESERRASDVRQAATVMADNHV
jgi:membrane protease YdiL (CAAX protease family)